MVVKHSANGASRQITCIYCAFTARRQWLETSRMRSLTRAATNISRTYAVDHAPLHSTTTRHAFSTPRPSKPNQDSLIKKGPRKHADVAGRSKRAPKPSGQREHDRKTHRPRHSQEDGLVIPSKFKTRRVSSSYRQSDRDAGGQRSFAVRRPLENTQSKHDRPTAVLRLDIRSASHKALKATQMRQGTFSAKFNEHISSLHKELKKDPLIRELAEERKEQPEDFFESAWTSFVQPLKQIQEKGTSAGTLASGKKASAVLAELQAVFQTHGQDLLRMQISWSFWDTVLTPRFSDAILKSQEKLADLRYPGEWFPHTRIRGRKFHMHVGPTNSGKTYQALQRLESVTGKGLFGGPLRLLAHEVYSRLNAKGISCYLSTGEERRAPTIEVDPDSERSCISCTVEMLPLFVDVDVCVIDEIQMIGDPFRGWAWTQAVLGVAAKEVHLCGEERAVPLLKGICASLGEELIVHRYDRLSPLKASDTSLQGDFNNLRKGDCVVSFSVVGIHALKKQIEKSTGRRVAVVYGSLPAETRAQQARLFNDPDNEYDLLVASDAIGMGLNLAIKRVIFETVTKYNGASFEVLDVPHIKQIAGRAGRYRVAGQAEPNDNTAEADQTDNGFVTTLQEYDLQVVQQALNETPPPITKAGIVPTSAMVERYAAYFPSNTPFSYILHKLWAMTNHSGRYFICELKDMVWVADTIQEVPLSIRERYAFCALPAGGRSRPKAWRDILLFFARCISNQDPCLLTDIKSMPLEVLDAEIPATEGAKKVYLQTLEHLHQTLVCYMWLSFRYAGLFPHRMLAKHTTELTEAKIAEALSSFNFNKDREALTAERKRRTEMALEAAKEQAQVEAERATVQLPADADGDDLGLDELHVDDQPRDDLLVDKTALSFNDEGLFDALSPGDHAEKQGGHAGRTEEASHVVVSKESPAEQNSWPADGEVNQDQSPSDEDLLVNENDDKPHHTNKQQ